MAPRVKIAAEPPPNRQLAVEYVHRDQLKFNPRNPNRHSRSKILKLAASVKALGMNVPVLVEADLTILSGEARVKACKEIGVVMIPIIRLEHLTPEEARVFMVAENRFAELSQMDAQALGRLFKDLSVLDLDFSLETSGFETPQIDLMIEALYLRVGEPENEPVTASSGPAVSRFGDAWLLHNPRSGLTHKIVCGDALAQVAYAQLLGDLRATAIITDPPFGKPIAGYLTGQGKTRHREFVQGSQDMSEAELEQFLTAACAQIAAYAKPGALAYMFMDWRGIEVLLRAGRQSFHELKNLIVWAKSAAGMGAFYRSQHELIALFKVSPGAHRNNIQLGRFGRSRSNVWTYDGMTSPSARKTDEGDLLAMHPTVKNVQMIADAMMDCTERGDIVLDPFVGSGTALIAAEKSGRRCYGLELDPLYVDVTLQRWQRMTGEAAVHVESGQSFDALAVLRVEPAP